MTKGMILGCRWKPEGRADIEMALRPEVQQIFLLDGLSVLRDQSQCPSQNRCVRTTIATPKGLALQGIIKFVDIAEMARLLDGVVKNAVLWIASSDEPKAILGKAITALPERNVLNLCATFPAASQSWVSRDRSTKIHPSST